MQNVDFFSLEDVGLFMGQSLHHKRRARLTTQNRHTSTQSLELHTYTSTYLRTDKKSCSGRCSIPDFSTKYLMNGVIPKQVEFDTSMVIIII